MFSFLRGILASVGRDHIALDVGGVGYKVHLPASDLQRLPPRGGELTVYTHVHVREDAVALYGFLAQEQTILFETLITVSGVGPRLALALLGSLGAERLRAAVLTGEAGVLAGVPGIGRKLAERIILELRGRLAKGEGFSEGSPRPDPGAGNAYDQAGQALAALGYDDAEIQSVLPAVAAVRGSEAGVEEVIRVALRQLSRGAGPETGSR